jgi:uncharacterized protein (DUF2249 family)
MTIDVNTKIATLIRENPAALESIVSISPKFSKLRNPILRKMIGGRTSIAMAAKIGGCTVDNFFEKLRPLGFEIDHTKVAANNDLHNKPLPDFLQKLNPGNIVSLDVRAVIESGRDPLNLIMQAVKQLKNGFVLKIINSFEPTPLILLLGKQGFISYTETEMHDVVNTYFYKEENKKPVFDDIKKNTSGWNEVLNRFAGRMVKIDVREMEMPLPMHTILNALKTIPKEKALFVYHKRIPVFLLPELVEQDFNYRIHEVSDSEVHLLIYKD